MAHHAKLYSQRASSIHTTHNGGNKAADIATQATLSDNLWYPKDKTATIAENIALYGRDEEIDYELLEKVIKITELESLIKHEMPNGFETVVGERGNRISGGQKQRIGLARALYRQPKILILDEATSALDTETESRVMSHISQLRNDMTIIMIAHRLKTLDICNEVYNIEQLTNV